MNVFQSACLAAGIEAPKMEYPFHPERKWRADYCWPTYRIILEVDGGIWSGGRHTRGTGFQRDCEKLNEAAILGYRVLRVTPEEFDRGDALDLVMRAVEASRP